MAEDATTKRRFWAGGFFWDEERARVLLHKRDANTKMNPNTWAFFGGLNEGDETPVECFKREIQEEIGIPLQSSEIVALRDYLNTDLDTYRYVFYVPKYIPVDALTLNEGEGLEWLDLKDLDKYPLTTKTVLDLRYALKEAA